MVVVAVSSVGGGRPTVVDLAADGFGRRGIRSKPSLDVSCGGHDGIFGCRFLHEGIVYGVSVVQLGLLRGKPLIQGFRIE
jgi:hypothetical protein